MPISNKLAHFLDARRVSYRTLDHREAFTAQEVAHVSHVPGRELAKVVGVRDANGEWLLAVLPAPFRVDLEALSCVAGSYGLRLAAEGEMLERFPDYEPGAVPPFERLEDVPVYLDSRFADAAEIYFEDGSHSGLVTMRVEDYIRVAQPVIARFSRSYRGH
jgi:Ala-tRNA(Pro) deacylase